MTTSLAITGDQTFWSETQLSALKALGLSNASKGDLSFFFHQAQRTGLDPFARQLYMIERGVGSEYKPVLTAFVLLLSAAVITQVKMDLTGVARMEIGLMFG